MSITKTFASLLTLCAIVVASYLFVINQADSSVTQGNDYNATTTTLSDVGTSSLKSIYGSIGSVIIGSTSPSTNNPIRLYDTASRTVATSTLTPILEIPVKATTGTEYVYDVVFGKGILLDVPQGFRGHYTITFR